MDDYARWYAKISAPFRSRGRQAAVAYLDKLVVWLFAIAFLSGLAMLAVDRDERLFRFALVPAIAFALVTVARAAIDAPRPYELFDINPVIRKQTQGKSMPSRHVASAVAIACAFAWLNPGFGAVAAFGCIGLAFTRIVGGVHFPRDVIAAIAVSTVCGFVGFALVP